MQIINPPNILLNGTRINGVEHIYQESKPTTRVNGSALVVGDIWKKSGQEVAEWNGTYWVGPTKLASTTPTVSVSTTTGGYGVYTSNASSNLLIEYIYTYFFLSPNPLSDTNYHVLRLFRNTATVYDLLIKTNDNGDRINGIKKTSPLLNIVSTNGVIDQYSFSFRYDAGNGSPPSISSQPILMSLVYRNIF